MNRGASCVVTPLKQNKDQTIDRTLMSGKCIILSEGSQTQKTAVWFSFCNFLERAIIGHTGKGGITWCSILGFGGDYSISLLRPVKQYTSYSEFQVLTKKINPVCYESYEKGFVEFLVILAAFTVILLFYFLFWY